MINTEPFPNGHNPCIEIDKHIKAKGLIDASLKGKTITLKAITEADVLEIRTILTNEIKRQQEEQWKYN